MEPSSALTVISEIAITIAGFTGMIVVLQRKKATSEQRGRILNILLICFMIILGALTPFALDAFGLATYVVWGISCALLGVLMLVYVVRAAVTVSRGDLVPVYPMLLYALVGLFGIVGILLLTTAFGWPIEPSAAVVLSALILMVMTAGYAFTATLIWAFEDST